jgi:hypothetical protein
MLGALVSRPATRSARPRPFAGRWPAIPRTPRAGRGWAKVWCGRNGGKVGGDAEAAFREALKRDPGQLGARYFLGEAAMARGDIRGDGPWAPLMWIPPIATA